MSLSSWIPKRKRSTSRVGWREPSDQIGTSMSSKGAFPTVLRLSGRCHIHGDNSFCSAADPIKPPQPAAWRGCGISGFELAHSNRGGLRAQTLVDHLHASLTISAVPGFYSTHRGQRLKKLVLLVNGAKPRAVPCVSYRTAESQSGSGSA